MITARKFHSCCALGDMLYAICGYNGRTYLNSIEVVDAAKLMKQEATQWNKININGSLPPRYWALVTAIDDDNIVILGGLPAYTNIDIFNVSTRKIENLQSKFEMHNWTN